MNNKLLVTIVLIVFTIFSGCKKQDGVVKQENGDLDITVKGIIFKMVKVDGGIYEMGATKEQAEFYNPSSDEYPVHQVNVHTFYIGETEVTQELWEALSDHNNPSYFSGKNKPVECVSHDQCLAFIERLNQTTKMDFRLPTEEEWEYAARGGNKSQHYIFSGSNDADEVAWYYIDNKSVTHDVKLKKRNELGIYDMSGNVLEWCSNIYKDYNDTIFKDSVYVLRGGCYSFNKEGGRVSIRSNKKSDFWYSGLGLRLALDYKEK
jgi:formylglycine-generating enzyme required for sulfatase activity